MKSQPGIVCKAFPDATRETLLATSREIESPVEPACRQSCIVCWLELVGITVIVVRCVSFCGAPEVSQSCPGGGGGGQVGGLGHRKLRQTTP